MTAARPTLLRAVAPVMPRQSHLAGGLLAWGLGVLLLVAPAGAQQRPLGDADQARVDQAIDRGVAFLLGSQQPTGTWALPNGPHQIGYAALPGLTLLECGVPPSDLAIQRVARFVRSKASSMDQTYELALSILFLDRLNNPDDEKLIQQLSLRLIAGQSPTGGWSYKCPILYPSVHQSLLTALRQSEPTSAVPLLLGLQPAPGGPAIVGVDPLDRNGGIVPRPAIAAPGDPAGLAGKPNAAATGNPNAAVTGNPGAAVSGTPVSSGARTSPGLSPGNIDGGPPSRPGDALVKPDTRQPGERKPDGPPPEGKAADNDRSERSENVFGPSRRAWCIKSLEGEVRPDRSDSQQPAKPTKAFVPPSNLRSLVVFSDVNRLATVDPPKREHEVVGQTTDNSNTQFAILALWAAQRHQVPLKRTLALVVRRFYLSQAADGSWTYAYVPGGGANDRPAMNCVGLLGLAVGLGLTDGQDANPAIPDARILKGFVAMSPRVGTPKGRMVNLPQPNLYELWSIERVAVLYNLSTIAGKDWYRWGAEALVANQNSPGFWTNGGYPGSSLTTDTCLALLFLKKANLASDLSTKVTSTSDRLTQDIAAIQPAAAADASDRKDKAPVGNAQADKANNYDLSAKNSGQGDDLLAGKIGPGSPGNAPSSAADKKKENQATEATREEGGRPWWAIILFAVCFLMLAGVGVTFVALHLRGKTAPPTRVRSRRGSGTGAR